MRKTSTSNLVSAGFSTKTAKALNSGITKKTPFSQTTVRNTTSKSKSKSPYRGRPSGDGS